MVQAGSGYRLVVGWVAVGINCVLFVGGAILLYWRRDFQPVKSWSPALLSVLLLTLIPGTLWVPVRGKPLQSLLGGHAVLRFV